VLLEHCCLYCTFLHSQRGRVNYQQERWTRAIANVHIHVEHVIGSVQQRFPILPSALLIYFLMIRKGKDTPLIDRIIHACFVLNSLCDSVVPCD